MMRAMEIWLSASSPLRQSRSRALADCTTLAPYSYDRDHDDDVDDGGDDTNSVLSLMLERTSLSASEST